jgi:hypothetical protein
MTQSLKGEGRVGVRFMAKKEDHSSRESEAGSNPPSENTQVKIRWDSSNMRSAYANVFNVTAIREEIVLLLGESEWLDKDERTVRLTNRILLNPFTAKRLLILLQNAVQKHELKYGPLESESPSPTGLLKTDSQITQSPNSGIQRTEQTADFLIQLVKELNVMYDFERSFKMSQQKMLWHRFLMVIDKNDIRGNPHQRILSICERMGMPEDFFGMFKENLSQANPVDFGFEADEGSCIYKAYLDFLPQLRRGGDIKLNQTKPHIMFLGFKWDVLDPTKKALTKYTWYPSLSFEEILEKLSDIYHSDKGRKSNDLAEEFLGIISSRTTHDKVYYLDVSEEHGQRRSYDINAYSANLQLKELYPLMTKIWQYFSIPAEEFSDLYRQMETKIFGHFSGGMDREGNDFLTVYFGLEPVGYRK